MRIRGLVAVLLLAPGGAHADEPTFHTLDRHSPASAMSLDVSVAHTGGATAVAGNLWADYVHASGAGLYVAFPATHVALDGPNQAALGNAEGGALYSHAIGTQLDLVGHVGVAYDYEHQGIAPKQYVGALAREGDLVQRWGFTTWLRFGVSALGRSGRLFWRTDVGVDLMLDDHERMGLAIGPIVRAGAGVGLANGQNQFTLEVVALHADATTEIDRYTATLALGARRQLGRWQPGIAVVAPVSQLGIAAIASVVATP